MANIQKVEGKKGTKYRALVRMKGVPPQSATFDRLTDARKWAQDTESAIRDRRYFKTAEAQRHTVTDMIDKYLKTETKGMKTGAERKIHLLYWKKQIGAFPLSDVTPSLISEIRDKLAAEPIITKRKAKERLAPEEGKKRGKVIESIVETRRERNGATVNRYLAAFSHCLSVATNEWEWMETSPMAKVKKLKESRGRVRFLDDDERERFLKACDESKNPYLYTIVILALSTGMRQSEMLELTWQDIDFANRRIILQETKNGERRAVPITGKAFERLDSMRKVRRINSKLVFAGTHALNKGSASIRTAFLFAIKKAQIENFKFHDLRHSAASYLAMNGATLAEIAEVLGHKTLSMVKRYAHLSDQHVSSVVERMNQKIFG